MSVLKNSASIILCLTVLFLNIFLINGRSIVTAINSSENFISDIENETSKTNFEKTLSSSNTKVKETQNCDAVVSTQLKKEIESYKPIADRIIKSIVNGSYKGTTYARLADFTDKFGPRIAGSKVLENAIDYMLNKSKEFDLENVHGENAMVPHWVRGNESAALLEPRYQNLAILGLGSSIGTPPEGITAEAIVVDTFEELEKRSNEVKGKIVVYNEIYTSYGETVIYRSQGATRASKYGAVAALVRSVTPFSLYTPHTGWQDYGDNITKIPVASITVEDAKLLRRISLRNETIKINLKMDAQLLSPIESRNTIAEIKGSVNPKSVVVISGHLDSWDVGQGAMDDGGGAFISWNALVILKSLELRAKRTLRTILWTAEEEGLVGAFAYAKAHKNETQNLDFVMESDEGTFHPLGFAFSGTNKAGCIFQEVMKLLKSINITKYSTPQSGGPDITVWTKNGIPGASLVTKEETYYWFHHTNADTMNVEDPINLDLCTAAWAVMSYVIADLSVNVSNPVA